jgi:hypothetical protein
MPVWFENWEASRQSESNHLLFFTSKWVPRLWCQEMAWRAADCQQLLKNYEHASGPPISNCHEME